MFGVWLLGLIYFGFGNFFGIEFLFILIGNGMLDVLDREVLELVKEFDSFVRWYIMKYKLEVGGEGYDFFVELDEDLDFWGFLFDEVCEIGGGGEVDVLGVGFKLYGISEVVDEI